MPLLQVRDLPEDLYESLTRVAHSENRSIAQETIVLLRSALGQREERKARRAKILKEIDALEVPDTGDSPDPALLIREDRDR